MVLWCTFADDFTVNHKAQREMQPLIFFFFLKQYQTYSTLDCSLNEMMLFFFSIQKVCKPLQVLYLTTPGSWQMLQGENTRPWRRRCSPSCLCLLQAICHVAMFPHHPATPVETSPLQSPHPSPLLLLSVAAHLQVTIINTLVHLIRFPG